MSNTTFTPIAAAVRKANTSELGLLQSFLSSDSSLDDFIADNNLTREGVQKASRETGITLPEKGLKDNVASSDVNLYVDLLRGDSNLWQASQTYGFDPSDAVSALQENNLRVPLSQDNRAVYDTALGLGFTSTQTANALGLDQKIIDTVLGGAGLQLPGRSQRRPSSVRAAQEPRSTVNGFTAGPTGRSFLESMFSSVPQAPGLKLGKNRTGFVTDTILSGPRGDTSKAKVKVATLLGGE